MNTTTITIEHLRDWSACYIDSDEPAHRELLSRLGDGVDLVALLRCPDVPVEDRIWVACRALDARTARLFACRCARRALERERAAKREPDPRSWGAVDVAERFARNEASAEELRAAEAAAAAARAAWAEAAGGEARAAEAAARAAEAAEAAAARAAWAEAAAWAAAARAARAAAAARAAWAEAAEAAERQAQIDDIVALLEVVS